MNPSDQYIRVGGLHILPALGEVLPEFIEWTEAELPLQLRGVSLFGGQNLTQCVDLLLNLKHNTQTRRVSLGFSRYL